MLAAFRGTRSWFGKYSRSEKENNASQARRRRCEVGDEQEESVEYWKIPDFTLRQATVFPMPHRDQRNEDTPSIDEPCHFSH